MDICTIYSCDVILAKRRKSKAFASCLFEWQFNGVNVMLHVKNYTKAHKIHYWSTHIFLCNLIILLHVLTISDHHQEDKR
jgi:hypothetical protein